MAILSGSDFYKSQRVPPLTLVRATCDPHSLQVDLSAAPHTAHVAVLPGRARCDHAFATGPLADQLVGACALDRPVRVQGTVYQGLLRIDRLDPVEHPAQHRVLVFGDSNTWGYDPDADARAPARLPDSTRATGVLARCLGRGWKVLEDGLVNRFATRDAPGAWGKLAPSCFNGPQLLAEAVARALPLDAVVLFLGTNDLQRRQHQTPEAIADAVARMVHTVRCAKGMLDMPSPSPVPLVVIPPPPAPAAGTRFSSLFSQSSTDGLGAAFRAALPHVPLVDAEALIGRSRSSDGVHLTRAEHFVLGKAMAKAVLGSLIAVGRAPNSDEYRAHLQQLSSDCCRLRFNGGMSEGNIASVVDQARNAHLIGLRCGRRLIGVAELHPIGTKMVEMALSIEEPFRGRGYGTLLFSTALDHMRARAIRRVCFLCQTNNTPMRKLLEKFRARQMREDNEIAAWIDLPAR